MKKNMSALVYYSLYFLVGIIILIFGMLSTGERKIKMYIIGLIYIVSCGGVMIGIIKKRNKEKLVDAGKRIEAQITDVVYYKKSKKDTRESFKLYCEFVDDNGKVYNFVSDRIWEKTTIDKEKKIPVYVDLNDYKDYYVNVDEYREI